MVKVYSYAFVFVASIVCMCNKVKWIDTAHVRLFGLNLT